MMTVSDVGGIPALSYSTSIAAIDVGPCNKMQVWDAQFLVNCQSGMYTTKKLLIGMLTWPCFRVRGWSRHRSGGTDVVKSIPDVFLQDGEFIQFESMRPARATAWPTSAALALLNALYRQEVALGHTRAFQGRMCLIYRLSRFHQTSHTQSL